MIRMIWLDFGKILCTFAERKIWVSEIVSAFKGDVAAVERTVFADGLGEPAYEALDNGSLSGKEFWKQICAFGKISPSRLTWERFFVVYTSHLQPIWPMVEFCKALQKSYPYVEAACALGIHGIVHDATTETVESLVGKLRTVGVEV